MRRANIIRRFLHIGVHALTFRKHWERSRAVKPFIIPGYRSNTLLVLVFLSAAGVLRGCHRESQIPLQSPRAVRLATVAAPQASGETLRYSASILPYAQVDLMFRSSGYVTNVKHVRGADGRTRDIGTGDYVEKGTILAHIRLEDMKNQVAQAQAQLEQAAVDNAKAALRQAELNLGDSDLKAPFSGFLLNRYIDLGSLVSPSSPAFTIADISSAKATFGVPDYALSRVHPGQQLSIALQDDVTPLVGRVTSIAPSADTKNRVFTIEVTVANRGAHLKPGMIASLTLGETSRPSVASVPLGAIVPCPSKPGCFAVMVAQERASQWTASLREVQLGATNESSIAVGG